MIIKKEFIAATNVINTTRIDAILDELKMRHEWIYKGTFQVLIIHVPDNISIQEAFSLGMLIEAYRS